ncbi:uncharacterized protein LOC111831643 [Capsella rubella]|uniref:uncharacterized protein LOC111831643 n=1 Tax=Capsella rubella TaxID=81985 RepID=UPI000CD571B8|nr:uncharacterized protein LOC111831643 [Capsella rubella]
MKKNINTSVHFDYGGHYSEEYEWTSGNSLYAILFQTSSLEEITYSVLVDKIWKKIKIDRATWKLKLSYSLSKSRRETYIVDDEDVCVFLTSLDTEGLIPVLRVELLKDTENNQRVEQFSREERRSSVGVNYGEVDSNGIVYDVDTAGMFSVLREGETSQQQKESINVQPIIEEAMENAENAGKRDCENMDDDEEDASHEYVELPGYVKERQYLKEWEDGTGLEKDQEFCSKDAVWDLVHKAANLNCFGVKTVKSDPTRLMVECSQASKGCKWYLRVTKMQKSDFWTVRVHRKMHTCSRAVHITSNSKQRGTSRLVASVLHEVYPGQSDTPSPKNIMNIVQGRLGLLCSYSSALRGKKQHVKDVQESMLTKKMKGDGASELMKNMNTTGDGELSKSAKETN